MQTVGPGYLPALRGSFTSSAQVDCWYDGELVYSALPLEEVKVTHDSSRLIQASATVTATDSSGRLTPSDWGAPLAPFGSELHIRHGVRTGVNTEWVSLGWFRIDSSDPREIWVDYADPTDPAAEPMWVQRGSRVTANASDRMSMLDDARFLAPEAPASLASVITEIKRLARDIVPIADLSSFTDGPIPASLAYQTSRVQAIQDLADVLDLAARVNPDGHLTLVSKSPTGDPMWTVEVGSQGEVVDWGRKLDRAEIYNAVVSSGTTADGLPVQGVVQEQDGPFRWGGPFGRVPYGHSSPLITSEAAAQADAQTRLERLVQERVVPITVNCVMNAALELDDIVGVALPDATLTGPVISLSRSLLSASMEMTLMVPRSQLWG